MKDFIHKLLSHRKDIPASLTIDTAVRSFSLPERIFFFALCGIVALSALFMLKEVSDAYSIEMPAYGGTLTEGIIGTPRFINPLVALSDTDRDLTTLIYSGLMRAKTDGTLIPDLAESYSISKDGLTYDFILRNTATFHDGTKVTADDVVFTITHLQDPALKSPRRANWEKVVVKKISDTEVSFSLPQSYAPFLENTTLGILPKHIWQGASDEELPFSQYNIEPIGSGPYKVTQVLRNTSGIPSAYELTAFKNYALGEPYITSLVLRSYTSETAIIDALNKGAIESTSAISPQSTSLLTNKEVHLLRASLPRIFGIFFNQNQAPVFANKEVRTALRDTLDTDRIVKEVLDGYGTVIEDPLPPGTIQTTRQVNTLPLVSRIETARKLLEKNGWKINPDTKVYEKKDTKKKTLQILSFSIATANTDDLKATVAIVKENWETLGAKVEVKIFEPSNLQQMIIRPRSYDALLFGEIVGRDLDLFAFWHSSQRNDPGLNIAMYTNTKADKLLEDARKITDRDARLQKYVAFATEVANDIPAVFTYAPDFIYTVPQKVNGVSLGNDTTPADRFDEIYKWYIEKDRVWKIFSSEPTKR